MTTPQGVPERHAPLAEWCDARGIGQLANVRAFHVATFAYGLDALGKPNASTADA